MRNRLVVPAVALLTLVAAAAPAHAHPGHGATDLAGGLAHPFSGLDHLLAMLAVGLLAGQSGGRARWLLPLTFVAFLAAGALLGRAGFALPFVEPGIAASLLVLGLAIATAARAPLAAGTAIVALFALFHGHAHGAEAPVSGSALLYGAGFVAASALLHAAGLGLASLARTPRAALAIRAAGAATFVAGLGLLLG